MREIKGKETPVFEVQPFRKEGTTYFFDLPRESKGKGRVQSINLFKVG